MDENRMMTAEEAVDEFADMVYREENPLQLGQDREEAPGKLERSRTVISQGAWSGKTADAVPEEVLEREGIRILVYEDGENGAAAEFMADGSVYHAVNEEGDTEQLLEDIEGYLKELTK